MVPAEDVQSVELFAVAEEEWCRAGVFLLRGEEFQGSLVVIIFVCFKTVSKMAHQVKALAVPT